MEAYLAYVAISQDKKLRLEDVPVFVIVFIDDILVYSSSAKKHKEHLRMKELNLRQRRWIELIKDYDCTIDYHPALSIGQSGGLLASFQVCPTLIEDILHEHLKDSDLQKLAEEVGKGLRTDDQLRADKVLLKEGRVCVPNNLALKQAILEEAHSSAYAMHPGSIKMYRSLKRSYWWPDMKREIPEYVDRTPASYDGIWFGAPVSIVSDRDFRFTSKFWPCLQKAIGTKLYFSIAFHPQTDGQSEWAIQTLEDMLRACVLQFKGSWDTHLSLIEFAYNNSYHSSIGMASYKALYGRPCRTPICWNDVGERKLLGPELAQQTSDSVKIIRDNLKTTRDRKKSLPISGEENWSLKLVIKFCDPLNSSVNIGASFYTTVSEVTVFSSYET
ncbi:uncharacterized protein LOC120083126 [Benincasa hispida]|uniref:uncharacterized protein LOC120083126 n=1 Tax=Benincasa hispida TaxID=102211 RepID=UPI0018FF65C7|nr:uncharacterized protein LOC120083126 [Benincasa hispida]